MSKINPKVCLLGNNGPWMATLRGKNMPFLPWGHHEVGTILEADICFWWACPETLTGATGVQVGTSLSHGIPVKIGAISRSMPNLVGRNFGWSFLQDNSLSVVVGTDPVDAYERAMADIDVKMPNVFVPKKASADGVCLACKCSYYKGDAIMLSSFAGGYHKDCYSKTFDRGNLSIALFNASLVEALRKENAELEEKVRGLLLHK